MTSEICVIVPTCNRSDNIILNYEKSFKCYEGNLFTFLILDSSTDGKTYSFFLSKKLPSFIKYKTISPKISLDEKVINGIRDCKHKYFYLCGDSNFIDYNELENKLINNYFEKFSLICLETNDKFGFYRKKFHYIDQSNINALNKNIFFLDCFARITFWGGCIVKTDLLRNEIISNKINRFLIDKNAWWFPFSIIDSMYRNKKYLVGVAFISSFKYLPKVRSWEKDFYRITFSLFNNNLFSINFLSRNEQKRIIKSFRHDWLVTFHYLLQLRIKKIVNLRQTFKYRKQIIIIFSDYIKMLIISLIPSNCITLFVKIKGVLKL